MPWTDDVRLGVTSPAHQPSLHPPYTRLCCSVIHLPCSQRPCFSHAMGSD